VIKDIILGWLECFGKKKKYSGLYTRNTSEYIPEIILGGHPSDFTQDSPHFKLI